MCTFSSSQLPKVVRTWCVLYILTSTCASRHNDAHFFIISTSKSGPNMVCFVHFDFETCFAPQWPAIFHHLNFQKLSKAGVLCTFWLGHVLGTTTACTFSSLIWPAGSQIIRQTHAGLRDFSAFSGTWIIFLLRFSLFWSSFFFSSLLFSSLLFSFSSLLFSNSSHLCFSSVHIVGSMTSRLPSITTLFVYTHIIWWYVYIYIWIYILYDIRR